MPAREVLGDPALRTTHALALAAALRLTGLRLVLHAPHDLHAGSSAADAQLEGALAYAATAGCSILVYHPGMSSPRAEAVSLRALGDQAGAVEVAIAVENLAPAYPGLAGRELGDVIEPVLERVILFHVHDNFGGRMDAPRAGGIEPLRLDLHLAPGAGSVPWPSLSTLLGRHGAPIQLEVSPGQRPAPATLAVIMGELLRAGSPTSQPLGA
jgi:sugar phosphate isomerase/epimerase